MHNGRRYGGNGAYSKPGDRSPIYFLGEDTEAMLTIGELSRKSFGETLTRSEDQIDATVRDGVGAFLRGYGGKRV